MLAALAPACPRPRVLQRRAFVDRGRAAPHSCWPRAADRKTDSCRSRLRDWLWRFAELHSDIAFARIRAHRLRKYANADLELRRHLIEHGLHDRGYASHHD